MNYLKILSVVLAGAFLLPACSTQQVTTAAKKTVTIPAKAAGAAGRAAGATAGGALGDVIGGKVGRKVGTAVGRAAGDAATGFQR